MLQEHDPSFSPTPHAAMDSSVRGSRACVSCSCSEAVGGVASDALTLIPLAFSSATPAGTGTVGEQLPLPSLDPSARMKARWGHRRLGPALSLDQKATAKLRSLFSFEKWKVFGIIVLSFVCDKYYLIID